MASDVISPGSTIGILGGGQLGRMLSIAAAEMGYYVHIFCPEEHCPAAEVSRYTTIAAYDDADALASFAQSVSVVTYEFENIPAAPVAELAAYTLVRPSPEILALSQHRVQEKKAMQALGISTAPFFHMTRAENFDTASAHVGFPCVMKTVTMGYDGKGQAKIDKPEDFPAAWESLHAGEAILEGFVNFRMEISVIVARDVQGNMACYDPVQNIHKHHILSQTIAPAPISPQLAQEAQDIARAIAEELDLVGILAVEMFVTNDDKILVNELAPRPHNSGHWTIDACMCSQFEQTMRAICGLPLGNPQRLCDAKMLNLIGPDIHDWPRYVREPNARLHLYGKKDVRAGRKMGHVTFLSLTD